MARVKIKVMVVGDSFTGKTCLLSVFRDNRFSAHVLATVFENEMKTIYIDDLEVDLQLWDTAGQESYDRLRPLVYPLTDVFVLCFALNELSSFLNVESTWVKEIRTACPGVPVLLVGNKKDLRVGDDKGSKCIKTEQGKALASRIKAVGYLECSAKNNVGVRDVFETAGREALKKKQKRKCQLL